MLLGWPVLSQSSTARVFASSFISFRLDGLCAVASYPTKEKKQVPACHYRNLLSHPMPLLRGKWAGHPYRALNQRIALCSSYLPDDKCSLHVRTSLTYFTQGLIVCASGKQDPLVQASIHPSEMHEAPCISPVAQDPVASLLPTYLVMQLYPWQDALPAERSAGPTGWMAR